MLPVGGSVGRGVFVATGGAGGVVGAGVFVATGGDVGVGVAVGAGVGVGVAVGAGVPVGVGVGVPVGVGVGVDVGVGVGVADGEAVGVGVPVGLVVGVGVTVGVTPGGVVGVGAGVFVGVVPGGGGGDVGVGVGVVPGQRVDVDELGVPGQVVPPVVEIKLTVTVHVYVLPGVDVKVTLVPVVGFCETGTLFPVLSFTWTVYETLYPLGAETADQEQVVPLGTGHTAVGAAARCLISCCFLT